MRLAIALLCGLAATMVAVALPASIAGASGWRWHLPHGIAPPDMPADNPMGKAKVELGHRLFYDADLSIDGTLPCATCHEQHRRFTDGNATHPGVHGDPGRRNVMGPTNVAYLSRSPLPIRAFPAWRLRFPCPCSATIQ